MGRTLFDTGFLVPPPCRQQFVLGPRQPNSAMLILNVLPRTIRTSSLVIVVNVAHKPRTTQRRERQRAECGQCEDAREAEARCTRHRTRETVRKTGNKQLTQATSRMSRSAPKQLSDMPSHANEQTANRPTTNRGHNLSPFCNNRRGAVRRIVSAA